MELFNDDRRDWQDLYTYINNEFKGKQGDILNPDNLRTRLAERVITFMGIDKEDAERVKVDINPFARKATITILPSDGVNFQAVAQLKDALEFGAKINIRF